MKAWPPEFPMFAFLHCLFWWVPLIFTEESEILFINPASILPKYIPQLELNTSSKVINFSYYY